MGAKTSNNPNDAPRIDTVVAVESVSGAMHPTTTYVRLPHNDKISIVAAHNPVTTISWRKVWPLVRIIRMHSWPLM